MAEAEAHATYEELHDIEREFDLVETEILRKQYELSRPLYEKRAAVVAKIPNFWALVFEQSPPEIDEYIQPADSALFSTALKNLSVSRFELDNGQNGDPRSIAIRFEFDENEYFEDRVLEKKFWFRHSEDYTGLVSEPVSIRWKAGKDLTDGLLDAVQKVWNQGGPVLSGKGKPAPTPEAEALKKKIEETGMGGVSFFSWFGFIGKRISAEESAAALAKEEEELRLRKAGQHVEEKEDDENDEDEFEYEIFPDGDDIAHAIAQDLWPDALSYWTQAQEAGELSDADFETDGDDSDEEMEG